MTSFPRLPSGHDYRPPDAPPDIVACDEAIIAIDKPSGLLSVPGKGPGLEDCLEARLRAIHPEALLLHRLDMDTSGIMIFARTREAQRHIARQFNKGSLEKRYQALVWGTPPGEEGVIDAPLIADWPRRPLQKICHETGKPSLTEWRVLGREGPLTRLDLRPRTGRSHQLRVHLASIGCPIAGDRFYASGGALDAAERLCLHAAEIRLRHPDGGAWVSFGAPLPF